jgi:hypothetical protein
MKVLRFNRGDWRRISCIVTDAMRRRQATGLFCSLLRGPGPLLVLIALLPGVARAQSRRIVDIEPVTVHKDSPGSTRTSIAVVGASFGFSDGPVIPYLGAGIGLLTAQIRLGLLYVPFGLQNDGFVARLEARPNFPVIPCAEPSLFANVGAGYRWQMESGPQGSIIGPGIYVMPAFEGGPAWIKIGCTDEGAPDVPLEATFFFGGTVALGLDF